MAAIQERVGEVRRRAPLVDHLLRMQQHYGSVQAGQQAGAVTYFAFLSIFPILALAVFSVGWIARVYPDANQDLRDVINSVLPGMVGTDTGQISLEDMRGFSGWWGVVGLVGVLYSGLGWISALRLALTTVFATPQREQPGFVAGKLRDLLALVVLGALLLVAVALTGFVSGFSGDLLSWLGLSTELGWLVQLLTLALGLAANVLLFFLMFRILADPHVPRSALLGGAVFGAIGFEILKQASKFLLMSTQGNPAFQAFGIALVLVVWINYSTRLILYAAAWAHTSPAALEARVVEPVDPVHGPPLPSGDASPLAAPDRRTWVTPFAAGGAAMLALVGIVRRLPR